MDSHFHVWVKGSDNSLVRQPTPFATFFQQPTPSEGAISVEC